MKFRKFALLGIIIAGFMALVACDEITTTVPTTAPTTATTVTTVSTMSNQAKVQEVIDALTLGDISAVSADITLPSPTTYGVMVSWSSSDEDVINIFGEVTVPGYEDGDATVTLTATVTLGAVTLTKEFTVTVVAQTVEEYLMAAANTIIITGSDTITANFTLPGLVRGAAVTWSSNNIASAAIAATANEDGTWNVTVTRQRLEDGGVNVPVTLTATLTIGETSVQTTRTIFVIAEPLATLYTSFVELHANSSLNDYIEVTGLVYATFNGGYFMVDDAGAFLAVYTASSATAIKNAVINVGDEVHIKAYYGKYSSYTLYQLINLKLQEVVSTGNEIDITPIVLENPADLIGMDPVKTLHGQVFTITVTPQLRGAYNNVYLFDGATRVATVYYMSNADSIDALEAVVGKVITIDVVYYVYYTGSSALEPGVPEVYVAFDGLAEDIELAPLEGQEALDADTTALNLATEALSEEQLTLPAAGNYGSVITWEVVSGGATIADGKATMPAVDEITSVVLRATLTLAGVVTPTTKDFTIAVAPIVPLSVSEAWALATGLGFSGPILTGTVEMVEGTIVAFRYNSGGTAYEGMFITDGVHYLYAHTGSAAFTSVTYNVGDVVLLKGTIQTYYYLPQIGTMTLVQKVADGTPAAFTPTEVTIAQIYETVASTTVSPYYSTLVSIRGTLVVGTSDNTTYIQNAEGQKLYFYRSAAFLAGLASLNGKEVIYTGMLYDYNSSIPGWRITGTNSTFEEVPLEGQEALDAAVGSLTISLEQLANDVVALPATGAYDTAVAWEVISGGAVIAAGSVTYPDVAVDTDVVLRATVSLGALTPVTKDFTVVVSPIVPLTVTETFDKIAVLGGSPSGAVNGTVELLQGTILGFKWKSGFAAYEGIYVTDGTHVVYVYTGTTATDAFALGDVVLIKGQIMTYYYLPEVSNITVLTKVEGATPAVFDTVELTIEQIYGYTNVNTPYYSNKIQVVGVLTVGTGDSSTFLMVGTQKLVFSRIVSDLSTLSALNGKEVIFTGFLNDYYGSYSAWRITGAGSTFELTEAQKAADDVAGAIVKTSVVAEEVVNLPTTATNGSTIAWAIKSGAEFITSLVDNVVTYANVATTSEAVLTGTFTYTPAVGDPIVTTKDYTISISTLEVKLAADKEALTVQAAANELDVITLPTTGANGSAITWALTETTDASLATNVLTLNYKGAAYSVTVTATLTLSTFTDTKEFTIDVSALTVLSCTEAYTYIRTLVGTGSVAGDIGYVMGTIIEFKTSNATNYSGAFITDGTNVIYVYYSFPKADYAIGDVVLIKGTMKSYYYLPEVDTTTMRVILESATPAEYTPISATIAEIAAYDSTNSNTSPYLAQKVVVSGTVVKDGSNYFLSDGTDRLQFYYVEFSDGTVLADIVGANITLTAIIGEYRSDGSIRMNGAFAMVAITDQDAVDFDSAKLPASLELTADYVLPTPVFAAFDITVISAELTSYLTESATGLTLGSQPASTVSGTVTVVVTYGTVTEEVVIPVTLVAMTDADKLALALADLPDVVTALKTGDYEIGTALYGSITNVTIGVALTGIVTWSAPNINVASLPAGFAPTVEAVVVEITVGAEVGTANVSVVVKGADAASDLIFSEYIEGSSNNKALEIYNGTGIAIDLSTYVVDLYSTYVSSVMSTTPSQTLALTGTLLPGEVIVIYNSSATAEFKPADGISSAVTFYNGDDALTLKNDGTIIDSFGQLGGTDPGTNWSVGGVATSEFTLVRISTVKSGRTDAAAAFDPSLEWVAYPQNTASYLGWHLMDGTTILVDTFTYADEAEFEAAWTARINSSNALDPSDLLQLDATNDTMVMTLPATANDGWWLARKYSTLASFGATDAYNYLWFYVTNNTNTTTLCNVWLYWGSQNAFPITLPAAGTSGWVYVKLSDSGYYATGITDFAIGFNNFAVNQVTGNLVVHEVRVSRYIPS
ncbi:MAG: immunoglobulin-like domain-containing protein [Candidatus Izemoplasmatales bacterium]